MELVEWRAAPGAVQGRLQSQKATCGGRAGMEVTEGVGWGWPCAGRAGPAPASCAKPH